MTYSASSLAVLARCPREHYYRYTLRLDSMSGSAAEFGTLVHSILERWYTHRDLARALDGVTDPKARALAIAYADLYEGTPFETLEVEREFSFDLDGHVIVGKIDAIIRVDGRVWIVEHKTTSADVGASYWHRLALDLQCSIYLDGARALGYDPVGVIYDVMRVPRHELALASHPIKMTKGKRAKDGTWAEEPRPYAGQRLRDETSEEFEDRLLEALAEGEHLLRSSVVRLEHELIPMRRDVLDWIAIDRMRAALNQYPRNPGACLRGTMLCPYFAACTGDSEVLATWPRRK